MTFKFSISTTLSGVDASFVWDHMTDMKGVNEELMPWMRMTYPSETSSLMGIVNKVPLRTTLFTSVLLLFGFLPIDLHWLALDHIDEGKGFDENSCSLLQKYWKHSRHITTIPSIDGDPNSERQDDTISTQKRIIVRDELEFCPRVPFVGYFVLLVVKFLFMHRHKQLKKKFQ